MRSILWSAALIVTLGVGYGSGKFMQSGERAVVEARGEARLKEIGEKLRVAEESVTRLTSERDEAREERF